MNIMMVYSYRYCFFDLPVGIVDCQVEGCPSRLYHVCQGEYVLLNDIDFEWSGRFFAIVLMRLGGAES